MSELAPAAGRDAARWPMTSTARAALAAEVEMLAQDVAGTTWIDGPEGRIVRLPVEHAARRLDTLRRVLDAAEDTDDPGTAVIGRRVTIQDGDGASVSYALVAPGEGDALRGWVSADAPLGQAVLGRRPGARVVVAAPGGSWVAQIIAVE